MRMLTDVLDECHAEVRRLEAENAALRDQLATALEDGARLSDALDVTHARFLAADAQLVREGQQAAALINRLAGAVGGSPVE